MTQASKLKGQERRQAQRVRAAIPLTIAATDSGAEALLKDISTNGLCCLYPEPLPEMTLVKMNLDLDDESVEIEGAVVRSEEILAEKSGNSAGWDVAIFFTNLSESAQRHIASFVAKQGPMQVSR